MNLDLKYNRYEEFKDSGEAWLDVVPNHWEIRTLKTVLAERREKNDPVKTTQILSLSMHRGVTLYSDANRGGNKAKSDLTAYRIARPNDIVINSMNVIVGSVGLSKYFGAVSPVYYTLYARSENVDINFYDQIFQNQSFQMSLFPLGSGILIKKSETSQKLNTIRLKIPMSKLNQVLLPVPPLKEQTRIARFLDQKTALIDKAIAQKERLIELLRERRQILIHRAVTRGLDAEVEMKDSGVEGLGKIPIHWQSKKLKFLLDERNERSETGEETLLMMSQIHGLVVRADYHEKSVASQSTVGYKKVFEGDLVFNKLKSHLGVFFKSKIKDVGIVSPDYAVYTSMGEIKDMTLLEVIFRHPIYIGQFICKATGIVEGLTRLYTDDLFDIKIPVPPEDEQKEIVDFIKKVRLDFSKAINLKRKEIEKLKEYKTTLINAAVTGKIKIPEDAK